MVSEGRPELLRGPGSDFEGVPPCLPPCLPPWLPFPFV